MKKYYQFPLLLMGVMLSLVAQFALVSCSDDDDEFQDYLSPANSSLTVFEKGFSFGEAAESKSIQFETGSGWTAAITAVESGWCTVSPASGSKGEGRLTVTVTANSQQAPRTATLMLTTGTIKKEFPIVQNAAEMKLPEGISFTPEAPDADQALTIYFKAPSGSQLSGYEGDVYAHLGVISEGTWLFVPAAWDENLPKCKMASVQENVWMITLGSTLREWFGSGTEPVNQLGIVIRNEDGTKKGQDKDAFITVTDTKYQAFEPAEKKTGTMPAGLVEGINVVDNSTVTLVLYDKDKNGMGKDYAHVVGDFNSWKLSNDDKSQMTYDDAAGCWWITIGGLDAAKEYAFQYYVGTREGGSVRLADAYAEKILDPDNDKYIPASTYDGALTYPEGGRGIVSVFRIQKDSYTWKVTDFKIARPEQLVIYELLLRDFTDSGDLQGAKAKLSYLKEMGVNAIELMPVQEFDGNDSWGYNPCFFFALDKAYGTKRMYKEFIDACHAEGIAVIFDVVYNHATGNHPFAKLWWNADKNKTAANNPYFNEDAPHPYSVFHDFNHESSLVRAFVKRNLVFLLNEYKIDGFRFDLTKGFTQNSSDDKTASNYDASRVAILKDYGQAIHAVNPDAYVILEHFCDTREENELAAANLHLWRNLNGAYCETAMGFKADFSSLYSNTSAFVGFMESHDEERMAFKQTKWGDGVLKTDLAARMDQLQANTAFFLTVPGPKMIWQFGEMGYDVSIEENGRTGRKPLHWEYLDNADRKELHDLYAALMEVRNAHPTLFDGNATLDWKVGTSYWDKGRTLVLTALTGEKLVALGNFTHAALDMTFPATAGDGWQNAVNGEAVTVGTTVNVPAHGCCVYLSK